MMSTFKKLSVFTKTTDFKAATKLVEVPLVDPAPDKIRVRQIYAGVNASDINITSARYLTDGVLPFDIGLEALGVVDAIGSAIPAGKFRVGQPVLVFDSANLSGYSEYSYSSATGLIPVPDLNPAYLVTLANGLTAAIALDKAGHVKAGETVLITAAAGGTGQIVVQWAKHRGANVIALTSSAEKAKFLKSLGVDVVINYRKENLDQVLTEKFPNGIDVIWETVGGETFKTLFNHLATKGRLVIIGAITTYKEGISNLPIENLNGRLLQGSKSLNGFLLTNYIDLAPEYLPQLIQGIAQKKIKAQFDLGDQSPEGKFFGLDQAHRASAWLHSGKNLGKVVVQLQNV